MLKNRFSLVDFAGAIVALTFSINVGAQTPFINSISTNAGPTAGGTLVLISGTNFGSSSSPGTVKVGPNLGSLITWGPTSIYCLSPIGQGLSNQVTVSNNGLVSTNLVYFNYNAPIITGIAPSLGSPFGGFPITISGVNLDGGGNVTVAMNGTNCTITSASNNAIVFTSLAGFGGNIPITVNVSNQVATTSNFIYLPPAITNITPHLLNTAGGTGVIVEGINLANSLDFPLSPPASVTIGGSPLTSPFVDNFGNITGVAPPGEGTFVPVVVTVGIGSLTVSSYVNYAPPSIVSVAPHTGPTTGGTPLTIAGQDFGTNPAVTLNGVTCSGLSVNAAQTQITCTTPLGIGSNLPLTVTVSNQSVTLINAFSYAGPVITSVTPNSGGASGGTPLTCTGSNFGSSVGTVTLGGNICTISLWGQNQIACTTPAGEGTNVPLVITTSGGQSATWSTFGYNLPSLLTLSPTNGPTIGGTPLTITGTNFGSNGIVILGGAICPITSWGQTQISCLSPPGQGTNLRLLITSDGLINSNTAVTFSYNAPSVTNVTPNPILTAGGQTLTIAGTNFGTNGQVTLAGMVCPVASWTNTSITITSLQGQGLAQPLVVSTAGQSSGAYHVNYNAPTVSSLNPNSGPDGGGTSIVIGGTNFGTSGQVTLGGSACPVVSWADGQITCLTPALADTSAALMVTVAGQSAAGPSFTFSNTNVPCIPGTYSATGNQPGVPAPPGYYVATSGATAPTPAPVGSYASGPAATGYSPDPPGTITPIPGMSAALVPGDTNADGIVSQTELDGVLSNYWANSPWVTMTNAQYLGNGLFQFALTNSSGWDFSVLVSSNANNTNWNYLGPAYPVYQFTNTATNAPALIYKLRYP